MQLKRLNIIAAVVFLLLSGFGRILDAPHEQFYVARDEMHPDALKNVKGILSIFFLEYKPGEAYGTVDTAMFIGFDLSATGSVIGAKMLALETIRPVSGVDYESIIVRRFPVVEYTATRFKIVFDVKQNLTAWVESPRKGVVVSHAGRECAASFLDFNTSAQFDINAEIFYLMGGKERRMYESANEKASSVIINSEDEMNLVPFRKSTFISTIHITEFRNGFARVSTRGGVGEELVFAGWVKLFDQDQLTVWEVVTVGC